jgi:DNA-nicking Smr family endonuclease
MADKIDAKPVDRAADDDDVLWQRVTVDVTPLRAHRKTKTIPTKTSAASSETPQGTQDRRSSAKEPPRLRPIAEPLPIPSKKPIDIRHGESAGIDSHTKRRLFRGEVPINRRLDLHGLTAARAQTRLENFIQQAAHDGCRCVLVITGKGAGILQGHVPGWLKRPPLSPVVLALAEARPADGGAGAFYVLLRRRRKAGG